MKRITDIIIQQQNTRLEILHKSHEDLKSHNIFIINEEEVSETQAEFVKNYFLEKVSPALATILLTDFDKIPKLKDNMAYLAVKIDRKSTRLNSSHVAIAYAVFCLKTKRRAI